MATCKLLVADPSDLFCEALTGRLSDLCESRMCCNGLDILECLTSFQPDVIVMDLLLPGIDGISVLRELCAGPRRPAILVTTRFTSPYIEAALDELRVDYVMMKPCNLRALSERIRELAPLAQCPSEAASDPICTAEAVRELLTELGISANLGGYGYISTAIELYRPGLSMSAELYPQIVRLCGGSCVSVERAIRTAVHSAWTRRDDRIWRQYFPAGRTGTVERPTNSRFIAAVSERLRCRMHRTAV